MAALDHTAMVPVDGKRVKVLRMPYLAQKRHEWLCFVFSLKMCLEYFSQFYPKKAVRKKTPATTVEELMELTNTKVNTGTALNDTMMSRLGEKFLGLDISMVLDGRLNDLTARLDDNLPSILIYNGGYYVKEEVGGPGHAGVLIGSLGHDLVFNNPWFGMHKRMDRLRLEQSWELEMNRAIIFEPRAEQTKLGVK